jgi:thiol-disulfide isomerase/thioredoxin
VPFADAPEVRGHSRLINPGVAALAAAVFMFAAGPADADGGLKPWIADAAPALILDQLDGNRTDLASFAARPVIVHFFATWCEPCVDEMTSLESLNREADGRIAILAVDVGEVDARVRRFFSDHPVSFTVLLDRDRAAMKAWGVDGLPTSFVLAPGLRPALRADEPLDWSAEAMLARLLALSSPQTTTTITMEEKSP